jgi:hypothetical protein
MLPLRVLEQLENFASSRILYYHWHTTFTLEQTFIPNFGKEIEQIEETLPLCKDDW